jgi:hypothetical protein
MKFLAIAYIAAGILVHVALWLLCRKTGVDRRGMFYMWLGLLTADWWGIFLVPLLWPLVAAFSLLWWAVDYWHLKSKRRDEIEEAAARKAATKYSHLTMDELLVAQRKMLDESHKNQ